MRKNIYFIIHVFVYLLGYTIDTYQLDRDLKSGKKGVV